MKFMKKMREVQHGSASFWYTDNDVCEDIDIDDDDHGYKSALSRELLSKPNLSNLWNL